MPLKQHEREAKAFGWWWVVGLILVIIVGIAIIARQRRASTTVQSGTPSKRISIAIVPKALTGEYWARCKRGAEKAAQELNVELDFVGPQSEVDVDKQVEIIENLISRGVDGIGVSPCDADALVRVIEDAMDKGIPVVTVDSDANTDKKLSYIGTDNKKAGRI
ncbi:MAG TPA: hypothetical protein EYP10_02405, partial [Armatimonadetes bacterium]|nr:hypothetical protein [Armatimonadota bacterium]